ncbi:MAG: type II secretion system minor pseudopilin GspK [Pseudomonadota bacterium]
MKRQQAGAALLLAMLTVSLVAIFAAGAFWRQWQEIEVTSAERARVQARWILISTRDWARSILREDAIRGPADNLAEQWAMPIQEISLSTFLQNPNASTEDADSKLSLQINDLQSRINLRNLMEAGTTANLELRKLEKLFDLLKLDREQLNQLASAAGGQAAGINGQTSQLLPQSMNELAWLGLSPATIASLKPYVILLPEQTPVNINTASAIVICASMESLDLSDATRLVVARSKSPFRSLNEAAQALGEQGAELNEGRFSIASRFFELDSRLQLNLSPVRERVILQRDKTDVKVLWSEYGTASL